MRVVQDELHFGPVRARRKDPQTSKEGASRVDNAGVRQRILETLRNSPEGLATWEVAEKMKVPRDYVSPHMQPLRRLGAVTLSEKIKQNPHTGRSTQVWVAT